MVIYLLLLSAKPFFLKLVGVRGWPESLNAFTEIIFFQHVVSGFRSRVFHALVTSR